jgi:hypothetical protein
MSSPQGATGWRQAPGVRVFAAWGATRTLRVAALISLAVGMAWVVLSVEPWRDAPITWIRDTVSYYDGAERLNAGHFLYRLSAGDRPINEDPFTFAGPFLYPPLIAVAWRPIAAVLAYDLAVPLFWGVGLVVFLGTLVYLIVRGGKVTAIGVLLLLVPLVWTAWSGNVSTVLTPAIIAAWLLLLRSRDGTAGAIVGFGAALKLTPMFLGWWLLVVGRWRGVGAVIVVGAIATVVGVAGAGIDSIGDYLRVSSTIARTTGSPLSAHSVAASLGMGPEVRALLTPVLSVVGLVVIALLRHRPRAAWAAAIATGVLAGPIVNLTNFSLLLAGFVAFDPAFGPTPAAWTARRPQGGDPELART